MHGKLNKYRTICIYLVLALATLAVFWQMRRHEFISFDDSSYIFANSHVATGLTKENTVWAFTRIHAYNWHPLTWLSHMLDCELYGLDTGSHHLANALLHTVNALLLLLVLSRMTGRFWPSAFVAAAFALHPLHVESVAWASERKDILSTLFWILTMAAYLQYVKRPGVIRYLLVFAVFALGLMAKQMLVTLPFVLLLLDYWPLGRLTLKGQSSSNSSQAIKSVSIRRCILEKLPLLVLSAAASALVYIVQQGTGVMRLLTEYSLAYRIKNAAVSCMLYIGKMFWPTNLAIFYPHRGEDLPVWQIVTAALLLVGITTAVIWKIRRRPYLTVGWLWYLGTLVPVIGLVQVGDQALADRYTYMTLTGLFIIIGWGVPELLASLRYRKIILSLSAVAVLLILAAMQWRQVSYWRNNLTLYEHTAAVTQDNWWAYNNVGIALAQNGKINEAIGNFHKALQLKPHYARAHNNLGNTLKLQGNISKATDHYRRAVEIKPHYAKAHNNLGITLAEQGRLDEALIHFQQASTLKPEWPSPLGGIALVLATHPDPQVRNPNQAIAFAEYAAELSKYQNVKILNTLATAYVSAGQFEQAISTAQTALELAYAAKNQKQVDSILRKLETYKQAKSQP